jgi:hypothetical protein
MAAPTHNPSRRALLGAAVAIPLLPLDGEGRVGVAVRPVGASQALPRVPESTPSPPSPIEGEGGMWERTLAAYHAAEAAAGAVAGDAAREEEYGDRLGKMYGALRRLLCLPAPGLEAFALKVVLAIDHELATLAGGEPCLAAIRREAVRLAAEQHSNILFPPDPAMPT